MNDESKLKEVVGGILGVPPEKIGPATSTDTVAGWDSLKHMRLVIALEEAFGVTIPDGEVAAMTSYDLIRVVIEERIR
jgi:acyl carrier protein